MEKENGIVFLPIPDGIKSRVISTLTPIRQKILVTLLHEPQTLSRLLVNIKADTTHSTILKALKEFEEYGCIEKTQNKVYNLTTDGKLLALFLAEPNGWNKEKIKQMFTEILKKDYGLSENDINEIIQNWMALSEFMMWKTPKNPKLIEEGYRESNKENVKIAKEMEILMEEVE
jgi:DNA-binding HxlR family transcriptional regulator